MLQAQPIKQVSALDKPIEATTAVIQVRDTNLAVALVSVGIPLRKDPPYIHVQAADGREQWTFQFQLSDPEGKLFTRDCIKAWHNDVEFIRTNPLHPFAIAMVAVKNVEAFRDHMKQSKPFVMFRSELNGAPATLAVMKDSRKHKQALADGLQQL